MIEQLQLSFTARSLARRSDPASSKRAAEKAIESGLVESHEQVILRLVKEYPGRTSKQLSALCKLNDVQITRRGKKMEEKGLVRRTAEGTDDLRWWAV